ncbi:MAG: tetratricopeptide repeat protein [Candidatus Wallbacteria bacterium]|nr:tetratricopeptide repeat protein [Candidatus Wallbacteria bacterium]
MGSDFYTPGQELSRRGILQIALEEAYRDGKPSDDEGRVVQYLLKAFKLTDKDYKAVKVRLKEKYKAGEIAPGGELDPVVVYRRVMELAFADAKISGKEKTYLKILAKVLWITPEEHQRVIKELKGEGPSSEEAFASAEASPEAEEVEAPVEPPRRRTASSTPAEPPAAAAEPPPPERSGGVTRQRPAVTPPPSEPEPAKAQSRPSRQTVSQPAAKAETPPVPPRQEGSHGTVTGSRGARTTQNMKTQGDWPLPISKPLFLGGIGAIGLVLLLFGVQQVMMRGSPSSDEEPSKPPVATDPSEHPTKSPPPAPAPPPPAPPKPAGANPEVEKLTNDGIQALQDGRVDEAIGAYTKSIAKEDHVASTHNNLGHAYERKGNDEAAIKEYQRAIQLDPKYPLAYNNLGTVYERKGRTVEAMALYRKAIELKTDYANAHYNLGVLLGRAGRYDEAIGAFKKVVELRPDDPYAHKDLWLAFSRKGLEADAKKELEAARKLGLNIGE